MSMTFDDRMHECATIECAHRCPRCKQLWCHLLDTSEYVCNVYEETHLCQNCKEDTSGCLAVCPALKDANGEHAFHCRNAD